MVRETQFDGNPLQKHIGVDGKEPLKEAHFRQWLTLFHLTIDELFEGEKAEEAKFRSQNIAGVFLHHIENRPSNRGQ